MGLTLLMQAESTVTYQVSGGSAEELARALNNLSKCQFDWKTYKVRKAQFMGEMTSVFRMTAENDLVTITAEPKALGEALKWLKASDDARAAKFRFTARHLSEKWKRHESFEVSARNLETVDVRLKGGLRFSLTPAVAPDGQILVHASSFKECVLRRHFIEFNVGDTFAMAQRYVARVPANSDVRTLTDSEWTGYNADEAQNVIAFTVPGSDISSDLDDRVFVVTLEDITFLDIRKPSSD